MFQKRQSDRPSLRSLDQDGRAAVLFFSINVLFYVANSTCLPYLTAHYANLGVDHLGIGILSSLGPISTMLILPIWSQISDRTGNRRGVLKVISLGCALTILLMLVSKSFLPLLISMSLFVCFFNSFVPLSDAITVSYLSKTRYRFSIIRLGGTVGYLVFVLISGRIFNYNSNYSFMLCSLFFVVQFFLVRRMPQVQVMKREKQKLDLRRLFRNKKTVFILFMACVVQIVLSCYYTFIGVYIRELGYTSTAISISSVFGALSEIPVLLLIDKALLYFSVPVVAIFSSFIMSIRILLLYKAQGLGLILLAQLGNGLTYMTLYYSCVTYLNNEMDDDLKSTGQSMLAFFQTGVGSIVGNVLGGFVSGKIGMKSTFLVYGVFLLTISVLCAIGLLIFNHRQKAKAAKANLM